MKLSDTKIQALTMLAASPMQRRPFSGWGRSPAVRIDVREATANKLLSLGLIERWDVEDDESASTIRITAAGRAALSQSPDNGAVK